MKEGATVLVSGSTFTPTINLTGKVGVVKVEGRSGSGVGVVFQENVGGNNLNGACQEGYGWFFPEHVLTVMEPVSIVAKRIASKQRKK